MNHLEENIILKYKKIKSGWYTHYPINGLWSDKINDEHFKNTFKSFLQKKDPIAQVFLKGIYKNTQRVKV